MGKASKGVGKTKAKKPRYYEETEGARMKQYAKFMRTNWGYLFNRREKTKDPKEVYEQTTRKDLEKHVNNHVKKTGLGNFVKKMKNWDKAKKIGDGLTGQALMVVSGCWVGDKNRKKNCITNYFSKNK